MSNVGLIILAAGSSTRLGHPKQLLQFRGRSLIRHAAETALQTHCRPIIVVTKTPFENELAGLDVLIELNPNPDEGIASSIRVALSRLSSNAAGTVIMLVDQPYVTARFIATLASCDGLAAAQYNNSHGVPAYFPRQYFAELQTLSGDKGAKSILQNHPTIAIPCPEAALDIDTPEQARTLLKNPKMDSHPTPNP